MQVEFIPRKNGQGNWCFAEKGGYGHSKDYPTLLFLHGIGKNQFIFASLLSIMIIK
jgi:hypothetical protein